ncbi:hypothetical protein L1987_38789 [Smallanthus sonchifolius]|uniref:Uncharacterized protein n=1 Tax=Smallanthus sonchifolius TaxID=185202 RepID=A0ACB9HK67_9ASTR|nr:hypothetical protein L1987_38789 [Smallanthus sonchifolius]
MRAMSCNNGKRQPSERVCYVEISKSGDIFHDFFRHKPHEMVAISPGNVHDCELHEGESGAVGSVITWHYTEGGKKTAKQIIESVNEENHTIVFKVIGGEPDVEKLHKSFKIIFHVEPKSEGQVVTWTFEFEKVDPSVPYETNLMDYLRNLVKDLDPHNKAA